MSIIYSLTPNFLGRQRIYISLDRNLEEQFFIYIGLILLIPCATMTNLACHEFLVSNGIMMSYTRHATTLNVINEDLLKIFYLFSDTVFVTFVKCDQQKIISQVRIDNRYVEQVKIAEIGLEIFSNCRLYKSIFHAIYYITNNKSEILIEGQQHIRQYFHRLCLAEGL